MNKKDFNTFLRNSSTKGVLDKEKVQALPNDTKKDVVHYLVRHCHPVMVEFILENDKDLLTWLASMGYLYRSTNSAGFTFLHTSEQHVDPGRLIKRNYSGASAPIPFDLPAKDKAILEYALASYVVVMYPRTSFTFLEWAKEIPTVYDGSNPAVAEVIRVLAACHSGLNRAG